MSVVPTAAVIGADGLRGVVESVTTGADDGTAPQALIRLSDGRQVLVPEELLVAQQDGTYFLPVTLASLERQRGMASVETTSGLDDTVVIPALREEEEPGEAHGGDALVVPVIIEELDVQKRTVETGKVRVTKTINEREELVDEPVVHEEAVVERVPINRIVDQPLEIRQEGDTTIIPLFDEVLVVEKRLLLKEEVRITKRQVEARKMQRVTLRQEEVQVERVDLDETGHNRVVPFSERGTDESSTD